MRQPSLVSAARPTSILEAASGSLRRPARRSFCHSTASISSSFLTGRSAHDRALRSIFKRARESAAAAGTGDACDGPARASPIRSELGAGAASEGDAAAEGDASAEGTDAGAPAEPEVDVTDPALVRKYNTWRARVFMGLFIGNMASNFTRASFTYVAPVLRSSGAVTLEQIGIITSIFPIAYGFSKFISGIAGDLVSPRLLFALGLFVTGGLNVLFTMAPNVSTMSLIWGLVGWFAATGAPVCTRLFSVWFSQSERGTVCGIWNTSQNLGAFLIAIVAGWAASTIGWKAGMWLPGAIGVLAGLYTLSELRASPYAVGLPPVEVFRNDNPPKAKGKALAPPKKESFQTILFKHVLSNPACWLLALSYFFFYFIRNGVTSWSHFYLMDAKGVSDAKEAAFRVSGREIGGLLGSLAAGWASDNMFGGRRVPIIVMFLAGIAVSILGFWAVPSGYRYLDWLAVSLVGFFLYGPQLLIGLAGMELVDRSAVSTASGFLGWIAYFGSSAAGHPVTVVVKKYGWNAYFIAMLACCAICTAFLLPLWNRRSLEAERAD
eukprot:tig00021108_g18332.t1